MKKPKKGQNLLNIVMVIVPVAAALRGCLRAAGRLGHDDLVDSENGNRRVDGQTNLPVL